MSHRPISIITYCIFQRSRQRGREQAENEEPLYCDKYQQIPIISK